MYQIKRSKQFEKSYLKLKRGGLKKSVQNKLSYIITQLAKGKKLSSNYRDHQLKGEYIGYRECHIQGDLLLVYKIERDILILVLTDIGSHSYVFG